jgi:hypothetical protein
MPAKSNKQRRFFYLVKALQKGKVSPAKVGGNVSKVAQSVSPTAVDDFLKECQTTQTVKEMISALKECRTNQRLNETVDVADDSNVNPIAKRFVQKGKEFEQYIQMFSGLEIKPKEMESINNYSSAKPTKVDKFSIRYESADEFGNSTITVIKKLREGNDLVFTAFESHTAQVDDTQQNAGQSDVVVSKSRAFKDEINGGRILADLLQKLEI